MEERSYVVYVTIDDYDTLHDASIHEGFGTYETALEFAKKNSKNTVNGQMCSSEARIYEVTRTVSVYQHPKTNEYVITEETL